MFTGIYRIKVSEWNEFVKTKDLEANAPVIKHYGLDGGLPSLNWNYLHKISNQLMVTTQKGVYVYNAQRDLFEKHRLIHQALPKEDRWFYHLQEDNDGNIWFDSDKGKGLLQKQQEGYTLSENQFKRMVVTISWLLILWR